MTKNKQRSSRRILASGTASLVAIFLLWSGFAPVLRGQEHVPPAEDHLTIAARYRQEAAETREALKRHQIAADIYRKGSEEAATGFNPQGRKQMVQHCERVIAHYTKTAKELDTMAAEHEALAQQPTNPGARKNLP
ncbi:MAG: hypothetical protein HYZ50_03115 [Deltaproteobacteria bacterium]|nr:hypothetical protein [Deltaproteobacteria bacterium]